MHFIQVFAFPVSKPTEVRASQFTSVKYLGSRVNRPDCGRSDIFGAPPWQLGGSDYKLGSCKIYRLGQVCTKYLGSLHSSYVDPIAISVIGQVRLCYVYIRCIWGPSIATTQTRLQTWQLDTTHSSLHSNHVDPMEVSPSDVSSYPLQNLIDWAKRLAGLTYPREVKVDSKTFQLFCLFLSILGYFYVLIILWCVSEELFHKLISRNALEHNYVSYLSRNRSWFSDKITTDTPG